jgi:ParB family chromosome partitioning protein
MVEIRTEQIIPLKPSIREVYSTSDFEDLKKSIEQVGIINPIHVIPHPIKKGWFQCAIGLHRLQCAKELGLKTVPAIIDDITEPKAVIRNYMEHSLQTKQNPMDICKMILYLKQEGYEYSGIAEEINLKLSTVKKMALLKNLAMPLQNRIKEGKLDWSSAFELRNLSEDKQIQACDEIIKNDLNESEIRQKIAEGSFGEEENKIEGSYERCFICGEMHPYRETRSKQICIPCIRNQAEKSNNTGYKTNSSNWVSECGKGFPTKNLAIRHEESCSECKRMKANPNAKLYKKYAEILNCLSCNTKDCYHCKRLSEFTQRVERIMGFRQYMGYSKLKRRR